MPSDKVDESFESDVTSHERQSGDTPLTIATSSMILGKFIAEDAGVPSIRRKNISRPPVLIDPEGEDLEPLILMPFTSQLNAHTRWEYNANARLAWEQKAARVIKSSYDDIPSNSVFCRICRVLYLADWINEGQWFYNETISRLREEFDGHQCDGHCRMVIDAIAACIGSQEDSLISSIKLDKGEYGMPKVTCWYGGLDQTGRMIDITFYVPHPNQSLPWAAFGQENSLIKDPGSTKAFDEIKKWISRCERLHPFCDILRNQDGWMPTRIVDVGLDQTEDDVRIVESESLHGHYLALSHCWGNVQPISLTRDSNSRLVAGVRLSLLTQTFQDAIAITRSLGVRYLWIDSLCIIQDSPEDWEHEAAQMANIYQRAHVVLSATTAASGQEGILLQNRGIHHIPTKMPPPAPPYIIARMTSSHSDFIQATGGSLIMHPLRSRGWTFQEAMLSTRTVHYAQGEMIWECVSTRDCECLQMRALSLAQQHVDSSDLKLAFSVSQIPESLQGGMEDLSYLELWLKLAEAYSERKLTVPTDRLPAISGLARRMQHPRLEDYHAGLWRWHIEETLLWRVTSDAITYSEAGQFVAPSWSWASRPYAVYWMTDIFCRPHEYTTTAKVLFVECSLAGADQFGRVTGGKLHLKANSVPAILIKETLHKGEYSLTLASDSEKSINFKTESLILDLEGDEFAKVFITVVQIKIFKLWNRDKSYCLVLCTVAGDSKAYERLGTVEVNTDWFTSSENRILKVV